jgi:transcriptional regulator with XRE-family HTH domain
MVCILDDRLRPRMTAAGIKSWQELSDRSQIGLKRLRRLRRGEWQQFRVADLQRLAELLGLSMSGLWQILEAEPAVEPVDPSIAVQLAAFQQLESFLTYWPAAAYQVARDPSFAAAKLLPLVKPIDRLLASWGMEAIGQVGEQVVFDPQLHQAMEGNGTVGIFVRVRYPGYRQGSRLLSRAKVALE